MEADGRAKQQAEAAFPVGVKGTGTSALPGQIALCVTLLTGAPGRSNRGRLFLGGMSTAMSGPNGTVSGTPQAAVVEAVGKFYVALRDQPFGNDDVRPVVVSPTTGTSRKITAVQIGNVLDTMRSRRNARGEVRLGAVVDSS